MAQESFEVEHPLGYYSKKKERTVTGVLIGMCPFGCSTTPASILPQSSCWTFVIEKDLSGEGSFENTILNDWTIARQ